MDPKQRLFGFNLSLAPDHLKNGTICSEVSKRVLVSQQKFAKQVSNSWFNPSKASLKRAEQKSQSPPLVSSLFSRMALLTCTRSGIDLTLLLSVLPGAGE